MSRRQLEGHAMDVAARFPRYPAFYECGERFAAAGWPSCAAAFFLLSYYLASSDQLAGRLPTDAARLESLHQVANSLRRLALVGKWDEHSVIALLAGCVRQSVGDSQLWPNACDAHETMARIAMNWREYKYAADLLGRGLRYAPQGSTKHISISLAMSYASFRAGDPKASGQYLEASRTLKGATVPDAGRYWGHALFRGGIEAYGRSRHDSLEYFERALSSYQTSLRRPDLNMRFRGLLAISQAVATLRFGKRFYGHSQTDNYLLAAGRFESGRILLAGDDPAPYGLGPEALELGNTPLTSRRPFAHAYLMQSAIAGPLVQDARWAIQAQRKSAVQYAIGLSVPLSSGVKELCGVLRRPPFQEYLRVFSTGGTARLDQRVLQRAVPRLVAAGVSTFPGQVWKLTKPILRLLELLAGKPA